MTMNGDQPQNRLKNKLKGRGNPNMAQYGVGTAYPSLIGTSETAMQTLQAVSGQMHWCSLDTQVAGAG